MTVKEVIERLTHYPEDAEVVVWWRCNEDDGICEGYDTYLCFDYADDKLYL